MRLWIIAGIMLAASPALAFPTCTGPNRADRKLSCGIDGDSGWEKGRKWRLLDIDAPEMHGACPTETRLARQSRDRLKALMDEGYRIHRSGRQDRAGRDLVRIRLRDGRDAGDVLMSEGLAQPWPNEGNVWCER
jgi:endonuclease YncB( thermonuclease family)